MLSKLTVKHLHHLLDRSLSVIRTVEDADDASLLAELEAADDLAWFVMGNSHMGSAAEAVILEAGDDAPVNPTFGWTMRSSSLACCLNWWALLPARVRRDVAASMDLTVEEIDDLFQRADDEWQRIKTVTLPAPEWLPSPSLTALIDSVPPCTHTRMVERPNDSQHAWECADCGYLYGVAALFAATTKAMMKEPMNYAALCRDVAGALQGDGFPAFSEMMGGGTSASSFTRPHASTECGSSAPPTTRGAAICALSKTVNSLANRAAIRSTS